MNHIDARNIIHEAAKEHLGGRATRSALQILQSIALLETGYGRGWKGAGATSHNWGAVQAGSSWKGPTFGARDTSPQEDGSNVSYQGRFRVYATDVDGASDMIRIVVRNQETLSALLGGSVLGVSAAMHKARYYEGYGKTPADRIRNHARAVMRGVIKIAAELGETLPDGATPPVSILRFKAPGAEESPWRKLIGAKDSDDIAALTKQWQVARGLTADGVVGPNTWAEALLGGLDAS